ncbi:hypothetical protein NX059_000161 [Plenodomus lindquistii]|nr:hypothetical protein NX059_000161 [Plenodomus lindquistii]
MSPQQTRQWILSNPPQNDPVLTGPNPTFTLQTIPLPPLPPDSALVKTLYLSNDPAQRGWIQKDMDPSRLYTAPVLPGSVMRAYGIGKVVRSTTSDLEPGTLVLGNLNWSEYAVVQKGSVRVISGDESAGIRPTHFLGALGATGLTAYYGLVDRVRAGRDDVLVVSGAAGATGSMVVQIAKHIVGCKRIVGIAGGQAKCKWVVESLGADACVDYKAESFERDLRAATEGGVDVYFDNVGGEILDRMLTLIKPHGRIAACGAVSTYNSLGETGIKNWFEIISNRIEVRGFIVTDALEAGKGGQWVAELTEKVREGKIHVGEDTETVVKTRFEDVPKTWTMLFEGGNTGKLITQIEA